MMGVIDSQVDINQEVAADGGRLSEMVSKRL